MSAGRIDGGTHHQHQLGLAGLHQSLKAAQGKGKSG